MGSFQLMSLLGTMFANFHVCGIMLLSRVVLKMLVRNGSSRGSVCLIYH